MTITSKQLAGNQRRTLRAMRAKLLRMSGEWDGLDGKPRDRPMSVTQRYAGMLRRHAGEWDKQGLPVQAECCRQAARHMETRELELKHALAVTGETLDKHRLTS